MDQAPKFTRHVWKQLWRLIRPYFFGKTWGRAWAQLGTLITLSVAVTMVSIYSLRVMRDVMTALEKQDTQAFHHALCVYVGTFAASIP